MTSTERIKALALRLALQAGQHQARHFRRRLSIRWKRATDPVTDVDRACEALIVRGIRRAFPGHGIIGEEGGQQGHPASAPYTWFIDPLDGTVNYSHGHPVFAVSIGVWAQGQGPKRGRLHDPAFGSPLVAVIHAPLLRETFTTEAGKGAFCNGRRIRVSTLRDPMRSIAGSGFSYTSHRNGENAPQWLAGMRDFQGLRRLGAASVDLSYVAAGRMDAFWEFGLNPWDVAAGSLLIEEAGGKVTDTRGGAFRLGARDLACSNGGLHPSLLRTLASARRRQLAWPRRS